MKDPLRNLSKEARAKLKRQAQPAWRSPMLATLTQKHFSDPGWVFESKLDGVRVLAFRRGARVRLLSRNRKELDATYPEVVDALKRQPSRDFIVDGEVVALRRGVSSFSLLQGRMHVNDPDRARASGIPVHYYVFDIVHLAGYDTTRLALRDRKALLKDALTFEEPLRYTTHRDEHGEAYLKEACEKGWEGLIAKRAASPYVHRRSTDWLKFKCSNQQEFVIGGYTEPRGSRVGFGALLLGYYEGGELRYAGLVGTGFDEQTLRRLHKKLVSLERREPPFVRNSLPRKGVHWVRPRLVGQVAFTEWTRDGKLRHPRFLGLRQDKEPKDVIRERAKS